MYTTYTRAYINMYCYCKHARSSIDFKTGIIYRRVYPIVYNDIKVYLMSRECLAAYTANIGSCQPLLTI